MVHLKKTFDSQDYKTQKTTGLQDYKTTKNNKLEISGMHNIRRSIFWGNNVKNLKHIIQNPIPPCSTIVILISTDKVLDLRERFFNRIEIRRIGWQEFNANAESIN